MKEILLLSGRHVGTNDAERRVAKRADELGRARIRYCSKRSGQQAAEQHHPIGAKDVGESPNVGGVFGLLQCSQ